MATQQKQTRELTVKNMCAQGFAPNTQQDNPLSNSKRNAESEQQLQGLEDQSQEGKWNSYAKFSDQDRIRYEMESKLDDYDEPSQINNNYEYDQNEFLFSQQESVSSSRLFIQPPSNDNKDASQNSGTNIQALQRKESAYAKPLLNIPMPQGLRAFILEQAPKGGMIQCTLKCDKSWKGLIYPKYHLYLNDGNKYLMSAQVKSFYSNTYLIYEEKNQPKDDYFAYIKINSSKKEYTLYNHGMFSDTKQHQAESQLVHGLVIFDQNNPKETGPRQLKALLHINNKNVNYRVINCVNTQAVWIPKHKAYYMNFYDRVNQASEFNFQLVEEHEQNQILLQFGGYNDDYHLDFMWPISPLQAFQIAVSRLTYS